jgi:hypothetical protein
LGHFLLNATNRSCFIPAGWRSGFRRVIYRTNRLLHRAGPRSMDMNAAIPPLRVGSWNSMFMIHVISSRLGRCVNWCDMKLSLLATLVESHIWCCMCGLHNFKGLSTLYGRSTKHNRCVIILMLVNISLLFLGPHSFPIPWTSIHLLSSIRRTWRYSACPILSCSSCRTLLGRSYIRSSIIASFIPSPTSPGHFGVASHDYGSHTIT